MKKSQKILFAPFDLLAHYTRCIEFAKTLKYDYQIVFLYSEKYNQLISENGFSTTSPISNKSEEIIQKVSNFDFSWINYKDINQIIISLQDIITDEKPDYIIGDTFLELKIICEKLKIPLICIINAYITKYYNGFRDVPHTHPANKFKANVNDKTWQKIVRTIEKIVLKNVHKPFNKLRKELNLEKTSFLFDEFLGDYNLICDSEEIFPLLDLPSNYYLINPIIYSNNKDENELNNFLTTNSNKPSIYVTGGSSGLKIIPDYIKPSDLTKYNIVVTGSIEEKVEENIYYCKFVNFDKIASKIDLVISHGGNGSMYQAIKHGKKIITIPSSFEQEWNVSQFARIGLCKIHFFEQPLNNLLGLIEQEISTQSNFPNIQLFEKEISYIDIINQIIHKKIADKA